MNIVYVAIGGAAGSVLRYGCQRLMNGTTFPLGTMLVNLAGCLLIGLLWGYWFKNNVSDACRLLLMTGFCGGFTTFSAFSQESVQLVIDQKWMLLFAYISISVVGGLAATFAGYKLINIQI